MKSLREKVAAGFREEEKCDVILTLANLIEDGKFIGNCPEQIFLDDDNHLADVRTGEAVNLAYWPPEVIREGLRPGAGKPQQWFLLGMLAYYIYYQTDYYTQNRVRLLELDRYIAKRKYVILPQEAGAIPFGRAVSQMTAVDPEKRALGLRSFLGYLSEQVEGSAEIRFTFDGAELGRSVRRLKRDIEDLCPSGCVLRFGGKIYVPKTQPVEIPYRPGVHTYNVPLQQLEGNSPERWVYVDASFLDSIIPQNQNMMRFLDLNRGDASMGLTLSASVEKCTFYIFHSKRGRNVQRKGAFHVERPAGISSGEYQVHMIYSMELDSLIISVRDESGQKLGPPRIIHLGEEQS